MSLPSKAFQHWLHGIAPNTSTADVCRSSGVKRTTLAQQLVRGKVAESSLVSISRAFDVNPFDALAQFEAYAALRGTPVPPTDAELVSQVSTMDMLRAVVDRSEHPDGPRTLDLAGTPHPGSVRNWVDAIDDGDLRHRVSDAVGIAPQNFSAYLTSNRLPPELALATSREAGVGPAGGLVASGLVTEAEAGWPSGARLDALNRLSDGELALLAGERLQAFGKSLRRQEHELDRTQRIWDNLA
ncbi:hypothetical protein [Arthrobacter sp. NyZ413]|uniref:hypothetical protein n=1 Tax=Arthrobacter sp. NyZ413 TaxID=3144669 RepID=UPI002C8763CF|nr:hypothetical protein [Arthrobacter sp.]